MPKLRWIVYDGSRWRLSALARAYGLLPQTLASRLDRGMPVDRALATGICSLADAGRRGARRTPWRESNPAAGEKGAASSRTRADREPRC